MKYSVVTFGCRVNQADSLGFEEELLRARRDRGAAGRRRPRHRQHLFGDRDRRSGRAADDPPHRPRQSRRADRRHRLLRDAPARRSRARCRTSLRVVANDDKPRLIHAAATSTASCGARRPARALRRRRRQLRRGDRAGVAGRTAFTLRVQTGCAEPCSYCIIPATRGAPRSVPIDDVLARDRARRRGRLQGNRADRRAPRLVRPRSRAARRR